MNCNRLQLCYIYCTMWFVFCISQVNAEPVRKVESTVGQEYYEINSLGGNFAYIKSILVIDNKLFFIGNTSDVRKSCRLSDLVNPRLNYLCSFDVKTRVLRKIQFPNIKLSVKMFIFGLKENVYLIGFDNIYTFSDSLKVLSTKNAPSDIDIGVPWLSLLEDPFTSREYLYYYPRVGMQLIILDETLKEILHVKDSLQPAISNEALYYGIFSDNNFLMIYSHKLSSGPLHSYVGEMLQYSIFILCQDFDQEPPIMDSLIYEMKLNKSILSLLKNSSKKRGCKLLPYEPYLFVCLPKSLYRINLRQPSEAEKLFENDGLTMIFDGRLIMTDNRKKLTIYDISNSRVLKTIEFNGYEIRDVLNDPETKKTIIICNNKSEDYSIINVINEKGIIQRKIKFKTHNEKTTNKVAVGGGYIYLQCGATTIEKIKIRD